VESTCRYAFFQRNNVGTHRYSIPEKYRPLPQRENVVLTRNQDFEAQNVKVFHSFDECLNYYDSENNRNIFIIGGGEIYKQALVSNIVQEMYITHVDSVFGADTFFPSFDINSWDEEILFSHPKDDKNEASFTVKKYVKKALTF
jgi:dihydrofolate reductase